MSWLNIASFVSWMKGNNNTSSNSNKSNSNAQPKDTETETETKPTVFWVVPDKFTTAFRTLLKDFSSEKYTHKVVAHPQFKKHVVMENDMIIYSFHSNTRIDEKNFLNTLEQILGVEKSPSVVIGLYLSSSEKVDIPFENNLSVPFEQQVANNAIEISSVKVDPKTVESLLASSNKIFNDQNEYKQEKITAPSYVNTVKRNPTIIEEKTAPPTREKVNIFTPETLKLFCNDIKKKVNNLGKDCSIVIADGKPLPPKDVTSKNICCYYMKDRVDEKLVEEFVKNTCKVVKPTLLLLISSSAEPGTTNLIDDWTVVKLKLQREINGNDIALNYDPCNNTVLDNYLKNLMK